MTAPNQAYTVPATGIPIQVDASGLNTHGRTVLNTGTVTVYAGDINNGLNGIPISPGNPVVWGATRPLYVWSAVGTIAGQILVIDSADPMSPVNVGISGAVTVSPSFADISWATPPFGGSWNSGITNVSAFGTLFLAVSAAAAVAAWVSVSVTWFADSAGLLVLRNEQFYVGLDAVTARLTLPTAGPYVQVVITENQGVGGATLSQTPVAKGAGAILPRSVEHLTLSGQMVGKTITIDTGLIAAGAAFSLPFASRAGRARYFVLPSGANPTTGLFSLRITVAGASAIGRGPVRVNKAAPFAGTTDPIEGEWLCSENTNRLQLNNTTDVGLSAFICITYDL